MTASRTNLAIVATVAFVVTIIAQPLAGALSDATRSRFGRRAPWIIFGALLAGGFAIGLPLAGSSLAMITLAWVLVQVGVNAVLAAAQAIVPDRFALSQRGATSSLVGVGVTVGNAVGAGIAGGLAVQGQLPYAVLGLLLLVAGVFVLVSRETSNVAVPRATFSWKAFAKGFWVNPRQHPDFAWAFAARFLMVIGFAVGTTYYFPWLSAQGHSPYAWTVLGAIAQVTQQVELMTYVTCPTMRYHPAVVAQKAATLQILAEGRFTLGLGAGENLNEHVIGEGWPNVDTRQAMLGEAMRIIRELYSGELVTFRGDYFDVDSARIWDLPKGGVPIGVAAGGPTAVDELGPLADHLIATDPDRELLDAWNAP